MCPGLPGLAARSFWAARLRALGRKVWQSYLQGKSIPVAACALESERLTDSYMEESSVSSGLYCLIYKMRI